MIIVDDRLILDALSGRLTSDESIVTTWSFHYRLVRALADEARWGSLHDAATDEARLLVIDPPRALVTVLDPRVVTARAAELARRHTLNLLAAELFAAAIHHRARVRLSAQNVGRQWRSIMGAEDIGFDIVD